MNEQEKMMEAVYSNGFALDEARLFLNTHPNDRAAQDFYRRKVEMYRKAIESYQQKYGPIYPENGLMGDRWAWAEQPWPWEGGK
jgi:spore coat protein JB